MTTLTAADYIAKWDGTNWSALGDDGLGNGVLDAYVSDMAFLGDDLYVGGVFSDRFVKWNGTNWSQVGGNGAGGSSLNGGVNAIVMNGNDIYVAGGFTNVNNNGVQISTADYVAKWDGTNWSALGNDGNENGSLNASSISILMDGNILYVAGGFTNVNNHGVQISTADYVAKWDGTNWSALENDGNGNGSLNNSVYVLVKSGNELYAGGKFKDANNNGTVLNTADYIAAYAIGSEPLSPGDTIRISVNSNGGQANGFSSSLASISANGRYITFVSDATNLVSNDTNGVRDIFRYDIQTGVTERVSVDSNGIQANGDWYDPAISADGRYIAFESNASNLVPGDTNGMPDIFVHDMQTGLTTRISVNSNTVQANNGSYAPSISTGGRYIAFRSVATNLVSDDTNGTDDIFLHDMQTGLTTRISVDSNTVQANNGSSDPSISADGRYIAFRSVATNLAPDDTNGRNDIFVHDMQNGTTTRVSIDSNGAQANADSYNPSISADGRYIAFESIATNLVLGDTNGSKDIFVYDVQTRITSCISVNSSGQQADSYSTSNSPSISGNGRYVAYDSSAANLVAGDTNSRTDAFVYDTQSGVTRRVSVSSSGVQANAGSCCTSTSADGRYIAFASSATNLVTGDTNGAQDIFVHRQDVSPTISVTNSPVTYNGSPQTATVTGSVPGVVSNILYNCSATTPTNAGTYAVTANFAPTDTTKYNSLSGASAGNFVINKLTPTISVANSPVTYNGSAQAATLSSSVTGLISNIKYNNSATTPTNAGVYGVAANFTPSDSTNYNSLTNASAGNLVINKFAIDITADAKTKPVGASDPTLTYTNNPALVSGDSFTGALTRASGETVGDYAITQGTLNAGNNYTINFTGANLTITPSGIDVTPPTVSSIARGNLNLTSATSVAFTVTFSELVTGVNISTPFNDFVLTTTGVTGAAITGISGSGTTYTVTVNTGSGSGTIRLDVVDDDSIKDVANNPLGGAGTGNGDFISGETYTIDKSANIDVFIAGSMIKSYSLQPSQSARDAYPLDAGPVKVTSTNAVPIIAALRDAYSVNSQIESFAQLMGLPQEQLSDTYYFPAYNNITLDGQLRFGNVDTIATDVTITIGGILRGTYTLQPNESKRVSFALDTGPVIIKSTGGAKIIAALRDAYKVNGQIESFVQLMGLPQEQLSDTYYFPAYNNLTLDGQLRFGNVDTVPTDVTVTIGGIDRGTYTLQPNESKRVSFALDTGPVIIKSTGGAKIIAALRDAYKVNGQIESFAQLMGLPAGALSDTYHFPAYNNVTLDGQLRFGNVDTVATDVTVTIGGIHRGTYTLQPNESKRVSYALDTGPVVIQSTGGAKIIAAIRDAYKVNGLIVSFVQLMGLPQEALSTTFWFPAYNNVTLSGQLRFAVP